MRKTHLLKVVVSLAMILGITMPTAAFAALPNAAGPGVVPGEPPITMEKDSLIYDPQNKLKDARPQVEKVLEDAQKQGVTVYLALPGDYANLLAQDWNQQTMDNSNAPAESYMISIVAGETYSYFASPNASASVGLDEVRQIAREQLYPYLNQGNIPGGVKAFTETLLTKADTKNILGFLPTWAWIALAVGLMVVIAVLFYAISVRRQASKLDKQDASTTKENDEALPEDDKAPLPPPSDDIPVAAAADTQTHAEQPPITSADLPGETTDTTPSTDDVQATDLTPRQQRKLKRQQRKEEKRRRKMEAIEARQRAREEKKAQQEAAAEAIALSEVEAEEAQRQRQQEIAKKAQQEMESQTGSTQISDEAATPAPAEDLAYQPSAVAQSLEPAAPAPSAGDQAEIFTEDMFIGGPSTDQQPSQFAPESTQATDTARPEAPEAPAPQPSMDHPVHQPDTAQPPQPPQSGEVPQAPSPYDVVAPSVDTEAPTVQNKLTPIPPVPGVVIPDEGEPVQPEPAQPEPIGTEPVHDELDQTLVTHTKVEQPTHADEQLRLRRQREAELDRQQLALFEQERQEQLAAYRRAREEAERQAREQAHMRARDEAERRARDEQERRKREEADRVAREQRARDEQERRERDEAERQAYEQALAEEQQRRAREADLARQRDAEQAEIERLAYEDAVRQEADRQAREEAQRQAEQQAREDAERQAQLEARAREEAQRREREEAERKAREEAQRRWEEERRARDEAERRRREEAEAYEQARRAREEAERQAREQAERRARQEADRQARDEYERDRRQLDGPGSAPAPMPSYDMPPASAAATLTADTIQPTSSALETLTSARADEQPVEQPTGRSAMPLSMAEFTKRLREADDMVRQSRKDLEIAQNRFGQAAVTPFASAIVDTQNAVRAGFEEFAKAQLTKEETDIDQVYADLDEPLRRLRAQVEQFVKMRHEQSSVNDIALDLRSRFQDANRVFNQSRSIVTRLSVSTSPEQLELISNDVRHGQRLLEAAKDKLVKAEDSDRRGFEMETARLTRQAERCVVEATAAAQRLGDFDAYVRSQQIRSAAPQASDMESIRVRLDKTLEAVVLYMATVDDFIDIRTGQIGIAARAMLVQANKILSDADDVYDVDPVTALHYVEQAEQVAIQAQRLASQDVQRYEERA